MSSYALSQQFRPSVPRKKPLSKRIELGITAVLVVVGMVLGLLSLAYLFYANGNATQDYQLKVLQEKRAELVTHNEVLERQIADMESLQALAENEKIARMVTPIDTPVYIRDVFVVQNPDGERVNEEL